MKHQSSKELESLRFDYRRAAHYAGQDAIKSMNYTFEDLMEHFPAFLGHMSLSRVLGLYELYKQTLGVAGHIAEVGVFKGGSFLLFAKLVKIFENESLTQVHGFDWFKGMEPDEMNTKVERGSYSESYERICELVKVQNLENIALIHQMDVRSELSEFLESYQSLQFKLVFLDAGMYDVVKSCLPLFWERLTPGGILVLDQFNHVLSPGETKAVREFLPNAKVRTIPNIWMPSGYIVKE